MFTRSFTASAILTGLAMALNTPVSALEPQHRVAMYSFHDQIEAGDYFTTPDTRSALNAGYRQLRQEGKILKNSWPGAVPLKQYFHPGRHDSFLLATSDSEQSAKNAGYGFVRSEGYVFQYPIPGTVPLKTYFHSGLGDFATVSSEKTEDEVKTAGYKYVRDEGYLFHAQDIHFGAQVLEVPIFSGGESNPTTRTATAYKTSFVVHPDTAASGCKYTWIGTVDASNPHDAVITICDTGVVGRVDGAFVDPSRMSKDVIFEGRTPPISPSPVLGPTIDIAIGYTPEVIEQNTRMLNRLAHPSPWPRMTSLTFMKGILQVAVDQTNAILGASGVPARLQLVNTKQFNIMEESFVDAQDALQVIAPGGSSDPYGVKAFRNHTGADLTSVWMYSNLKGKPHGAGHYGGAFSVVKSVRALSSTLTFAHEVAHNMGAHHPASQGDVGSSPGYARGYDGPGFYTIMSNGDGCDQPCIQVPYFSNPFLKIDSMTRNWSLTGAPAGHPNTAYNVRRMREESGRLAAFRTLKCPGNAPVGCGLPGGSIGPAPDPDDPPVLIP